MSELDAMQGQESLQQLLAVICSVFDAYSAVLFLLTSQDDYRLAASFSLGDNLIPGVSIGQGKGLVGWIIRNDQPLLIDHFDRQGGCLGYYPSSKESNIKAFMGQPLGQGKGALCVDSKKTYSFTPKDQKILDQFARVVDSCCLDYAQAKSDQEERVLYACLKDLFALPNHYSLWSEYLQHFVSTIAEHTMFSNCFLVVSDKSGRHYFLEGWNRPLFRTGLEHRQRFNIKSGLIGWVFKNQSMVSSDASKESIAAPVFGKEVKVPSFSSVVCMPLVVQGTTRGVLVLADKEIKTVSTQLRSFLELVIGQLGLHLENLYLKSRLYKR